MHIDDYRQKLPLTSGRPEYIQKLPYRILSVRYILKLDHIIRLCQTSITDRVIPAAARAHLITCF